MEKLESQDGQFYPEVKAAFARRKELLNMGALDSKEMVQIHACTIVGNMTLGRAIDKLTSLELFRRIYQNKHRLGDALATAKRSLSLPDGSTVYRLPNGDWIQPETKHYIPADFPWAQAFERALREQPTLAATAPAEVLEVTERHIEELLRKSG